VDGWQAYMHAPDSWILEGFTTDALLVIGCLVDEILGMRMAIRGGLSHAEERLKEAMQDA
jgi:hypothetical protein